MTTAGKGAVRCEALDMAGLAAAEEHGKRQDRSSRRRKIREASPFVGNGLDLRNLYDAHVADAKLNKAAKKPVLHFIVRFPPELLEGPGIGQFTGTKLERQMEMLKQAITFIDQTHGGNAVFAARLDRDEEGETIVDVFAAPKYEKRTRRTPADKPGATWISSTKFGRELADKHQDEIRRRHPEARGPLTSPRAVGIALQSEFALYFEATNGVPLTPKVEKGSSRPDRLEKEQWAQIETERRRRAGIQAQWDRRRARRLDARAAELAADQQQIESDRAKIQQDRAALVQERNQLLDAAARLNGDRAELAEEREKFRVWAQQLREGLRVLKGAMTWIGGKLGIDLPCSLPDVIQQIEAATAVPEPAPAPMRIMQRMSSAAPETRPEGDSGLSGLGL